MSGSITHRAAQICAAEKRLPALEADIPSVEEQVANTLGSTVPAQVIGIHIEPDGSAVYDCTFFGGEHEDPFFAVSREPDGGLVFNPV